MNDSFESWWELNHRSLPVHDPKELARVLYSHIESMTSAAISAQDHATSAQDRCGRFLESKAKLISEVAELRAWKAEQLQVENEWKPEVVARELELPVGLSIRKGILPAVQSLKRELTHLRIYAESARKEIAQRDERIKALEANLRRFGQHDGYCSVGHLDGDGNHCACDCGFEAALNGAKDENWERIDWLDWFVRGDDSLKFFEEDGGVLLVLTEIGETRSYLGSTLIEAIDEARRAHPIV